MAKFCKSWLRSSRNSGYTSQISLFLSISSITLSSIYWKNLKTLIINQGHEPKRTHNLIFLFQESKLKLSKELTEYIERLNPHYQPARYPDISYNGPILKYDSDTAIEHLNKTKQVFKCIEKKLIQ